MGRNVLCSACAVIPQTSSFFKLSYKDAVPPDEPKRTWGRSEVRESFRHLSIEDLKASASDGCHLCVQMFYTLATRTNFTDDTEHLSKNIQLELVGQHCLAVEPWIDSVYLQIHVPGADQLSEPPSIRLFTEEKTSGPSFFYASDSDESPDDELKETYRNLDESIPPPLQRTVAMARYWLRYCEKNHKGCRRAQRRMRNAPSRLIRIGTETGKFRLVNINPNNVPKYLTLSHCWGGSQILKLTATTEDQLSRGMLITALPNTFRDAVETTRYLGYGYLWVDSLCIRQDSKADWASQSQIMGEIYQGSVCTLAAAAAENSTKGCFSFWSPLAFLFCKIYETDWCYWLTTPQYSMPRPLETRGWVFQESILSPRTLSFSSPWLEWECLERKSTYMGSLDSYKQTRKTRRGLKRKFYELCFRHSNISDITSKNFAAFNKRWWDLVNEYTQLDLTFESDKLPAVVGLMEVLRLKTGLTPIMGHWKELLPHDLLWIAGDDREEFLWSLIKDKDDTQKFQRAKDNRAPSWSWVSINGPVRFQQISDGNNELDSRRFAEEYAFDRNILATVVTLAEPSPDLRLNCPTHTWTLTLNCLVQRSQWGVLPYIQGSNPGGGKISWFIDDNELDLSGTEVHMALIMRSCRKYSIEYYPCSDFYACRGQVLLYDEGLVLKQKEGSTEGTPFYIRVGVFCQRYWQVELDEEFVLFKTGRSAGTTVHIV